MSESPFHLESLLAPISLDEFFSGHWEKAPLVCARREPSHYQAPLNVSDIDFIVSSAFTMDKAAVEALGTAEVKKFLKGLPQFRSNSGECAPDFSQPRYEPAF